MKQRKFNRKFNRQFKQMIERLEPRRLLSVSMVKDINTSESGSSGPLPSVWDVEPAGSFSYVSAIDATVGWELYRTDGTAGGTTLVKDIRPGIDHSQAGGFVHMGGGIILFTADDGVNGFELWRSDGTQAGTFMVKDINPGAPNGSPQNLTNIGGTLLFSATTASGGTELWKSDGTLAGTVQVKDINAGTASSSPTQLINNNGTLFFRATTASNGAELWKSNGTDAGTVMVKELSSTFGNGMQDRPMAALGGYVYFAGTTNASGTDLWRSDGTDPGTTMVVEVSSTTSNVISGIKASGSLIYYVSTNASNTGLWRTDAVNPAVQILAGTTPFAHVDANGTMIFGSAGTLYASTGGAPTALKSGLTFRSFTGQYWTNVNGVLYLPSDDSTGSGEELWRSDGSPGGTYMLKDINPGSGASSPGLFFPTGGSNFYFAASTPATGIELFKSDGTEPGTQLVKNIYAATASSGPIVVAPYNGKLYFMAFEPGYGEVGGELYSSDGTEAGTGIFMDIMPGPTGSSISSMRVFNGRLYFTANNGTNGRELWSTDGTPGGTSMLTDINPGSASSDPFQLTVSGSYLYFGAVTTANGEELWRTDGTPGGTIRLTDVNPLSGNSNIDIWGETNGTLYFTANNASGPNGLWRSGGTVGTTAQHTTTFSGGISDAVNVNNTLYIAGSTSANGSELFKIVGTGLPTLVKEIVGSFGSSSPTLLTNVSGTLFFTADTSGIGRELWKSDGTDPGTVLVKDIRPGFSASSVNSLTGANGIAYFRADNGVNGPELWRSDGTTAGTYLLKDIYPGSTAPPTGSSPTRLAAFNGFVYFAADNLVNGLEVWRSDGTPDGTVMLGDFYPENSFINVPANGRFFSQIGSEVLYVYTDETHGDELWRAAPPDFASLGGGVVTVNATANHDVIDISVSGGNVVINLNGLIETFAVGSVSSIQLVGKGGNDTVNVISGTHTFSTDLRDALGSNATVNIAGGASVLFTATQRLAALNIASGADATLQAGGPRYLITDNLSLHPSGSLDMKDNDLVVNNGDFVEIFNAIVDGYFASTGITSSTSDGSQILAVFDNALIGATEWEGFSMGANAIVGKYTYFGDVNFDGQVTGDDYTVVDANLDTIPTVGIGWLSGDANLDHVVTGDDYTVIDANLGLGVGNPLSPQAVLGKSKDEQENLVAAHAIDVLAG